MAPEDETAEVTEPNEFRSTLAASIATVRDGADAVHAGHGSRLDAITTPIASGGWVCPEADSWTTEMQDRCSGITEAFDDALLLIQQRMSEEPHRVPEDDWRGLGWSRTWARQHHLR